MNAVGAYLEPQGHLLPPPLWRAVKDGDDLARQFFDSHYSRKHYRDGRKPKLFVGPGEKLVLVTSCRRGLFVWRKFKSDDGQEGVNCAVFRNTGAGLSSELIRAADAIADERWPGERHFTYVNPVATASRRSRRAEVGHCFIAAGWRRCGTTKWNKLAILERPWPECPA
jgi:hypothetical protein